METLKSSMPVYQFLHSLTHTYKTRSIPAKNDLSNTPSSSNLYEDSRNENLLVYIGAPGHGRLVPRDMAGTSCVI